MASLSNINGLFDVHSTGAILFSTSHGTTGQILRSNGNAAPTWVAASTVIGGPYLPLTGGTLSGPLAGTSATFSGKATFSDKIQIGSFISNDYAFTLKAASVALLPIAVFEDTASANGNGIVVNSVNTPYNYIADFKIGNVSKVKINKDGGIDVAGNVACGNPAGTNTGVRIYYGAGTGDYGSIRFYSNAINTNTIHIFSDTWQSGTIFTKSSGAINIDGNTGVTFGAWSLVDVAFKSGGPNYFRGNVGIGTDSPGTKLVIEGANDAAGTGVVEIKTTGTNLRIGGNTTYSWIQSHSSKPLYINQLGNNVILNLGGGNVGIGTDSPQGKLDSVAPVADLTDFGRATGSALNIRIANVVGHLGQINFCNDAAPAFGYGSIGMVMTSGSGIGLGDMVFGTKSSGSAVVSTERMRIDSNGSIGMGANSSSYRLRIKTDATVTNGVYISAGTGNGNHSLYVEDKDATAEYFAVRGDGEIRLNASSGHTYAAQGIRFGANAASNNLDHYEEGNWTPVIAHNDGTGVVPLNVASARYVRVGELVYVSAYLTAINPNGNAGGSGAYYGIRGFPFTPENYGAWQIVYASSGITAYGGYSAAASLYFMANGTNGQRSQAHVNGAGVNAWGSSVSLMMNCVYNING